MHQMPSSVQCARASEIHIFLTSDRVACDSRELLSAVNVDRFKGFTDAEVASSCFGWPLPGTRRV